MGSTETVPFFEGQTQWLTEKDTKLFSEKIKSTLSCKSYGFDCNFITKGETVEKIIDEFREHTLKEHFIDYPEGIVMKLITKKK
ncbi:MAG TPA: DUF1059 domain-containing protein [Nitrosopumilaceae archaeon]|nr:DUF1059 domain-containing protein [Nitrosopumilaceae archaeon]